MSGPLGSQQFLYSSAAASAVTAAGQSLRFEDGDSPYFSFQFGTPTNQIKWTMSFWCKRGEIGREHAIYGAANGGGETFFVAFYPDDIEAYISTGRNHVTNAVFRDPSAWYHIVQVFDSANATADDRFITYVNGVRQATSTNSVALNDTTAWNTSGVTGYFGKNYAAWFGDSRDHFDGYLANVTFIDGTALTPTSFGEYDGTLWRPKSDADITSLTFGTNGFYLPMKQTTKAEGFSTVTYTGNGGTQGIEGVGFEPDFVWIKNRSSALDHRLFDSVRGANETLFSNTTSAEFTDTDQLMSFDSEGFTVGADTGVNQSSSNHVAWCWDAGSGSATSNTDGSITSSVKANTAQGFSVVSYTSNASGQDTVGHGLTSTPEMIITKSRDGGTFNWSVFHASVCDTTSKYLSINNTNALSTYSTIWGAALPTSSVFGITSGGGVEASDACIAYCFHSVSGYSSIGSYTGNGSATGPTVTTGFKPAFVLIKSSTAATGWAIVDNTRSPTNPTTKTLFPELSNAEYTSTSSSDHYVDLNSNGFQIKNTNSRFNASGQTFIYMAFADTRDATFFGDTSGNGNNWTPNALNNTDVVLDSPVSGGNFATLNTVDKNSSAVISEGNLEIGINSNVWYHQARATMFVNSGKWYWEVYQVGTGGFWKIGIRDNGAALTSNTTSSTGFEYYAANGNKHSSSGAATYTSETSSQGKIFAFALDMDVGTLTLYVNNVSQGTMFSGLSGYYAPTCSMYNSTIMFNFGQDSSFAGNETPQGNGADDEDFYYTPPSGFVALKTSSLPTPAITAPDEYFNTVLWAGNNTTGHAITGVNFQSDWTWIKLRNGASGHRLVDAVRGVTKYLDSTGTSAETTNTDRVTSFDSDGFTLGNSATVNGSFNYVGWNWLAGNGTVSNTSGSITSTVSANTDSGFSIVTYTGTGALGTVGHGLSATPEFIIFKRRNSTSNWISYNSTSGSSNALYLDLTNGNTATTYMNSTDPTASVFTVNTNTDSNANGGTYVAYCFHSVEGYSKIGSSYTGNGSADGTFVHCGFRPSLVMTKRTNSTGNWQIHDAVRDIDNEVEARLYPNVSNAEITADFADFTANGFKLRNSGSDTNASGSTYIFLAFASAPFSKSNAR